MLLDAQRFDKGPCDHRHYLICDCVNLFMWCHLLPADAVFTERTLNFRLSSSQWRPCIERVLRLNSTLKRNSYKRSIPKDVGKITDSLYRSNKYVNSVPLQKPDRKWGTAVKWLNFIKLHSNVTYETALPTKNKFVTNYLGNTITRLSSHLTVYLSDQGSIFKYIWKWYSHNPSFAGHLLTKVFPSEEIVQHTLPYPERNDIFFREHIWTKDL